MEEAKDHLGTRVHKSDQSTKMDSMDRTDNPPDDDGQSEAYTSVDLSGLYELKNDGSDGTECPLVGESGLWSDLDDAEARPGHCLDVELDDLCIPPSREAVARVPEIPSVLDGSAGHKPLDIACPNGDDRFTRTVVEMTGWRLDKDAMVDESPFCPILTDGEKNYEFVDWEIHITFRHKPGSAILGWSPETLEEDVRRAASLAILEDHTADELAEILRKHFSSRQLRQLLDIMSENI